MRCIVYMAAVLLRLFASTPISLPHNMSSPGAPQVGLVARPLVGKSALVTGASRGIGAAIAKAFAAAGADVAISYSSSPDKAQEVVKAIQAAGQKGYAIQADHAKQEQVVALVHEAAKKLGKIDILVNNAGIFHYEPLDGNTSPEALAKVANLWAINVTSVATAVRAASKYLLANETGRIINIGSFLGEAVPIAAITDYSATKSALISYTKGWARDFAGKNITVNCVEPGHIDTDMNPSVGPMKGAAEASPAGRHGRPDEIAAAVLFIATPAASFVNAALIPVDGGINA
jgi:3-oxoacyl-[acyl-carrier protein] reductase